jgi:LPS export ABC transporter protein LptC
MSETRLSDLQNNSETGNVHLYSRFIKSLRIILPLAVLGIVGILFLWPQLTKIETVPLTQQDVKALKQAETENRLLNPIFTTVTVDGKPVSVTAASARQSKSNDDQIFLTDPFATMADNGNQLELKASTGVYNQNQKILNLSNGVEIKDEQNNVLTTRNMTADMNNNIARSNTEATLTTDIAVITGQSVTIDQINQKTIFHGPARAVITK